MRFLKMYKRIQMDMAGINISLFNNKSLFNNRAFLTNRAFLKKEVRTNEYRS
jgi:hypothetical protein